MPQQSGWSDRFQLIDSFGVLHHLQDPLEGCRALAGLLVEGGVLRVGLYSRVARADKGIDQARARCAELLADPTQSHLRQARRQLLDTSLIQYLDFHSLAGFRDLLAPAQEEVFAPSEAAQLLLDAGLSQVKLLGSEGLMRAFAERFPGAAVDDWEAWDRFEEAHPFVFSQMFTFCGRRASA